MIPGCNLAKKSNFWNLKFATLSRKCQCESGSEEKITRVFALALTLALFLYPERTKVATSMKVYYYIKYLNQSLYNI